MKKYLLVGVLSLATFGKNSFAAPSCPPFAATKIAVTRCEDNFLLGRIADQCLSLFTKELTARRPKFDQDNAGSSQNATMKDAAITWDKALAELELLIRQGEEAKFALTTYQSNIFFPEDYDNPALIGMSTEKYLSTERCYSVPRKVMDENSEMIDLMLSDLRKAADLAAAKSGKSRTQAIGLDSKATGPMKVAPAKLPAGTAPPNPGIRNSDISGVKEEKK